MIPHDILKTKRRNKNKNMFEHIDVLMIGINTSSVGNVSVENKYIIEQDCSHYAGDLSSESISITILGNNTNTTHLSSNINFTFPCDNNQCDESFECVWYNEKHDIWETDGCKTIINVNNSEIICSCQHLTTFATIHNVHAL
eukprot:51759_1